MIILYIIETYAGSFEQEDTDIDARPYAIDGGETSPDFKGFHRIEALIHRDGNLRIETSTTKVNFFRHKFHE